MVAVVGGAKYETPPVAVAAAVHMYLQGLYGRIGMEKSIFTTINPPPRKMMITVPVVGIFFFYYTSNSSLDHPTPHLIYGRLMMLMTNWMWTTSEEGRSC